MDNILLLPSPWGVDITQPDRSILRAADFLSHSQLLKFLFCLFTMFTLIKVSSIHLQNNTRGAHTECQFKGEYPTSSSIDIDILCFVIEYPVMFLSSLSGDKHDDMFCGDSTKRNNKHPLVHQ